MSASIDVGDGVTVTLQRTLRIPDDGGDHPLPPSLGAMPTLPAAELAPAARDLLGIGDADHVVALRDGEALWLSFAARSWHPSVLKVGLGATCAVTGGEFRNAPPRRGEQDYLVVQDQPWLDGVSTGDGCVRQFVATPLGTGATVEEQRSGDAPEGGLRFTTFAARPGQFPDEPPAVAVDDVLCCSPSAAPLGLAAGGRIRQEIYEDNHGYATWEREPAASVRVALVEAVAFAAVTGLPLPSPPVDAWTYTEAGLPWFELHDPARVGLDVSAKLRAVRSLAELRGRADDVLVVDPEQVVALLNGRGR
ncbi:hypothetical protein DSM112329_04740 [Paraconexibacter sp. AEG42_29]|uniref:Uncharacterized protein n=1 Tax=Paraconexibacter sp. AEG42_29 TaxID=2997339 RepID=A0AAU7B1U4_9ACTN